MTKRTVVAGSIGGTAARRLASDGTHVIGVDVQEPTGGVDEFHKVDLSDPEATRACCHEIASGGPLWGLVYAAGRNPDTAFDADDMDLWQAVLSVGQDQV